MFIQQHPSPHGEERATMTTDSCINTCV